MPIVHQGIAGLTEQSETVHEMTQMSCQSRVDPPLVLNEACYESPLCVFN